MLSLGRRVGRFGASLVISECFSSAINGTNNITRCAWACQDVVSTGLLGRGRQQRPYTASPAELPDPAFAASRPTEQASSAQTLAMAFARGDGDGAEFDGARPRRSRGEGRRQRLSDAMVHMQHRLQNLAAAQNFQDVVLAFMEYAEASLADVKANGSTDILIDGTILRTYIDAETHLLRKNSAGYLSYVAPGSVQAGLVEESNERVKSIIHRLDDAMLATMDTFHYSRSWRELFRVYLESCARLGAVAEAKRALAAMQGFGSTTDDVRAHILVARACFRKFTALFSSTELRPQLLEDAGKLLDRAAEIDHRNWVSELLSARKDLLYAYMRAAHRLGLIPLADAFAAWRSARPRDTYGSDMEVRLELDVLAQLLQTVATMARQVELVGEPPAGRDVAALDGERRAELDGDGAAAQEPAGETSAPQDTRERVNYAMRIVTDALDQFEAHAKANSKEAQAHPHKLDEGTLLAVLNACVRAKDPQVAARTFKLLKSELQKRHALVMASMNGAAHERSQQYLSKPRLPVPAAYHAVLTALALSEPVDGDNARRFRAMFEIVGELARDHPGEGPASKSDPSWLNPQTSLSPAVACMHTSLADYELASNVLEEMRMEGHEVCCAQYNILAEAAGHLPTPVDANGVDMADQIRDDRHPLSKQLVVIEAMEYYKHAGHTELEVNTQTWNAVVRCLCRYNRLDYVRTSFQEMADKGVPKDSQTFEPLLRWMLRNQRYKGLVLTLQDMLAAGITPPYQALLAGYHAARNRDAPEQEELRRMMMEQGGKDQPGDHERGGDWDRRRRSRDARYSDRDMPSAGRRRPRRDETERDERGYKVQRARHPINLDKQLESDAMPGLV